jgi:uridylate kinase
VVFNLLQAGNIRRVVMGEAVGTTVGAVPAAGATLR